MKIACSYNEREKLLDTAVIGTNCFLPTGIKCVIRDGEQLCRECLMSKVDWEIKDKKGWKIVCTKREQEAIINGVEDELCPFGFECVKTFGLIDCRKCLLKNIEWEIKEEKEEEDEDENNL